MARVRLNTTIEEDLLIKAKEKAIQQGLDGANAVIEEALRIYFANCSVQVWEKTLQGGWLKKLILRPDKIVFESIRIRKVSRKYNPKYYSSQTLEPKGWTLLRQSMQTVVWLMLCTRCY